MKSQSKKILVLLSSSILPVFASAQVGNLARTNNLLTQIKFMVRVYLIPLAFTLSLLYFFWGVAKYIKSEGDGKAEGKNVMIWGIVALFVISSVWGIVNFIGNEVGVGNPASMPVPRAIVR